LTALGLWERVEFKLVPGADVRQALVYVERGEADVGLVYATDAAASERVTVAFRFDESATGPIVYPLVLTSAGVSDENAQRFFAYLQTPDAAAVFEAHGFRVR
jgi:molybdate transport system substrate-binding protein